MLYKYSFITMVFVLAIAGAKAQATRPDFKLKDFSQYIARQVIKPYDIPERQPIEYAGRQANTDICPCFSGCSVLPVTLLSFEGKRTFIDRVLLYWKTTYELQNKGFVVERSLENISQFKEVGFVPSIEGSAKEKKYEMVDGNDFDGNSYYRLKQLDMDGGFSYSNTIMVKGYAGISSLRIYPNPVRDNLVARIYFAAKGNARLFVMNSLQQVVATRTFSFDKGTISLNLPVGSLSGGLYYVKIIGENGEVLNSKFVK